jgi:hypothetical protein
MKLEKVTGIGDHDKFQSSTTSSWLLHWCRTTGITNYRTLHIYTTVRF